jgi:hypothetical protein
MNDAGNGLRPLSTDMLKTLLRLVHRGTLPCPFQKSTLMSMGLNEAADHGTMLCGLEEGAVRAVLVCVIAERIGTPRT